MLGLEYTAVNAKVRYWLSLLLKDEDLSYLVTASLNDVIEMIKRKEIKVKIDTLEVKEIEGLIKQAIIAYIKSGQRFLGGKVSSFLQIWLQAYRIENLKTIARAIVGQKPIDFLYRIDNNPRYRMELVRELRTLDDLQEFLRGTEYYRIAESTLSRVKQENNTFFWEIALDNYYAQKLVDASLLLDRASRQQVRELLFFSMEMSRWIWVYRLRYHYGMSIEETIALVPNILKVLTRREYYQLVSSESPTLFFGYLEQRGFVDRPIENLGDLERLLNRAIVKRTRKYITGSPFNFGLFLSFIILKSMDVRSYIILLESKKAGVGREVIENLLLTR